MQISTAHTYAKDDEDEAEDDDFRELPKKSAESVLPLLFFFLLFLSGNSAKVNRMSTAHMQGEHLIKSTHHTHSRAGRERAGGA